MRDDASLSLSAAASREQASALPDLNPAPSAPMLGVFDSGVGGLTVLRAVHRVLPGVPLHYVADTAYAPYGERGEAFVAARSVALAAHLLGQGARLLVLACNTATAHAVDAVRARWPQLPVVGIEPGIKPAVAASRHGRIGVMATQGTLHSARFAQLLAAHRGAATVVTQACTGLAHAIERASASHALDATLQALIETHTAPLRAAGVDTVLLGCTHYPLVQPLIAAALGPGVQILNIEDAVAREAARRWQEAGLPTLPETAAIVLQSTGDPALLARLARDVFGTDLAVQQVRIEPITP